MNLGLFSQHYQPHLPDWPANYHVIGFCPWAPDEPALPSDVEHHLDGGERPVLVTLGSNAAAAHPDVFVDAARILTKRRVRGVFLTSNADVTGYVRERIDPVHGVWPFVPLEPLLERSRAVVHAGGLGTLASTLRAGLPSVIRPAVTDQIWHGQRCEELGVGVRVRRHLEDALSRVLDDEQFGVQAAELGTRLRAEDGPAVAADRIEDLLSR